MRLRLFSLSCFVLVLVAAAVTGVADAHREPSYGARATAAGSTTRAAMSALPEPEPVPGVDPTTTLPPPPTTTTTAEVIPPSRMVFVVGDSLTQGAAPWLPDMLRSVHWGATAIDAVHGRKTAAGLAALAAHRADLPPTVLVALGTNDLDATPEEVDSWVKQARILVGNRRLIWVNLNLADLPQFANFRTINAALAAAGAKYRVEVANWDVWSTTAHVRHLGDGVHYPAPGYERRAEFYARVLAARR